MDSNNQKVTITVQEKVTKITGNISSDDQKKTLSKIARQRREITQEKKKKFAQDMKITGEFLLRDMIKRRDARRTEKVTVCNLADVSKISPGSAHVTPDAAEFEDKDTDLHKPISEEIINDSGYLSQDASQSSDHTKVTPDPGHVSIKNAEHVTNLVAEVHQDNDVIQAIPTTRIYNEDLPSIPENKELFESTREKPNHESETQRVLGVRAARVNQDNMTKHGTQNKESYESTRENVPKHEEFETQRVLRVRDDRVNQDNVTEEHVSYETQLELNPESNVQQNVVKFHEAQNPTISTLMATDNVVPSERATGPTRRMVFFSRVQTPGAQVLSRESYTTDGTYEERTHYVETRDAGTSIISTVCTVLQFLGVSAGLIVCVALFVIFAMNHIETEMYYLDS